MNRVFAELRSATPRGRMLRGVAANIYDKGVILAVQLASIPVLTSRWGVDEYGVWLMLLTVPTYLQLADFGMGTAASVDITRSAARNDHSGALEALQSVWAFISSLVMGIAALVIGYAAFLYLARSSGAGDRNLATCIVLVTIYAIIFTQMSVLTIAYRATHKYATAMTFSGTVLLLEGAAVIAIALAGGRMVAALSAYVLIRLAAFVVFAACLRRLEPWVALGFAAVSRRKLSQLAGPSLAAFALTLSVAVAIQGALLTLGWAAGAAAVAIFGAARTIARAPLQLAGLVTRPSLPELTRAQLAGDDATYRRLNRVNIVSALLSTVPIAVVIAMLGPQLLSWVSGGQLQAPRILFAFLAGATVANAAWMAVATPLIAANRQGTFAYVYLMLCAGVALSPLAFPHDAVVMLGASLLVGELACGGVVLAVLRSGRWHPAAADGRPSGIGALRATDTLPPVSPTGYRPG